MNIQNTVNNREGLLCAQSEDSGILVQHRTEPRIDSRLFAKRLSIKHKNLYELIKKNIKRLREMCSLLTFQTEAVKEKATIEVRTKESIKNNRLMQFVQYKKQTFKDGLQYFIYSNLSSAKNNQLNNIYSVKLLPQCYSRHQGNISLMMRLPDNIQLAGFGSIKLGKPKSNPDSDLQLLTSPILGSAKNNHSSLKGTVNYSAKFFAQCYSEHQGNISPMIRLPDNIRLASLAQSGEYCSKRSQPLGVMPLDFNSFLSIRLIQVAKDESPSLEACSSSCALNCSGRRIWYCGDFFNSCIDMCNYPLLALLYGSDKCNYFITIKQRSPVVLPTHTEPLTTMLNGVTVMALYKSTQTHPKFTDTYWIIRLDSNIPYGKVSLTRRERRLFRVLFKDDRLVWSGRKPITPRSIIECSAYCAQEVAHA